MNLKLSVFSLFAVLAAGTANAQDILFRVDGGKEEVKVKEVGTRTIVYKKWTNKDGPDFVVSKSEVERIEFENGDEEFFSRRGPDRKPQRGRNKRTSQEHYGKNILAIAPISMNNTSHTGIGLSYERVLDKNYIVSFVLPATYSFRTDNGNYYTTNAMGNREARVFWISPGVKFYPAGSNHKVTYAVGANIPFVTGNEPMYVTTYNNNGTAMNHYVDRDIFLMGVMVTNYLNIQPTPKLYLGLQFGLGIPYVVDSDNSSTIAPYYNEGKYYNKNTFTPLVDFSFRVGFRF
jgi:hypothetical protein